MLPAAVNVYLVAGEGFEAMDFLLFVDRFFVVAQEAWNEIVNKTTALGMPLPPFAKQRDGWGTRRESSSQA